MTQPATSGTSPQASIGTVVLILGALTIMPPLATDMYLSAFPKMAEHFQVSGGEIELSLSLFVMGLALGQIVYGPMIDRFGRKIPLMIGVLLFTLSSLAIVLVPEVHLFLGLRFLQAIGGCAGMVISRAIIDDMFEPIEGARVLSTMMLITGIGPVLAPILGSYLVEFAGWQSIFILLFVFGASCLVWTFRSLPETLPKHGRSDAGLVRVLQVFAGLLTQRSFLLPALTGSLALGGLFAFITASPAVFMNVFNLDHTTYGWVFALNAVGMIVGSQVNRALLGRFSMRSILFGGLISYCVFAMLLLLAAPLENLVALLVPLLLCIGGIPVIIANATALAMSGNRANAGSASALIGVLQFGIAGLVSAAVSMFSTNPAISMSGGIAITAIGAFLIFLIRPESHRRNSDQ